MTPMQLSVATETRVFLLSCLCGVGLGVIYDCLRILRILIPHRSLILHTEDFFYALFFGFVYLIFAVAETGQLRFFTLVGMFLGALIERASTGSLAINAVRRLSKRLKCRKTGEPQPTRQY